MDPRASRVSRSAAPTAGEALVAARSLKPDVVVMDVVMPGESGIEATRKILADVPATRVLVLSQSDDPADVRDAFAAGASGFPVAFLRRVDNGAPA